MSAKTLSEFYLKFIEAHGESPSPTAIWDAATQAANDANLRSHNTGSPKFPDYSSFQAICRKEGLSEKQIHNVYWFAYGHLIKTSGGA